MLALMAMSFGFITLISPHSIEFGAFRYMLALGITPAILVGVCAITGGIRAYALYYNGHGLPWTARIRATCAVIGASTFGLMGLCLAFVTKDTGTISLGVGTHLILACAEIYSCLKAGVDANQRAIYFAGRDG